MTSIYSKLGNQMMAMFNFRSKYPNFKEIHFQAGFYRPFITIAREPGSGGHPIGRALADQLGFKFVDEQLIEEVSKYTKKKKEILFHIDEKGRTAIEDLVQGMINPDYVSDLTFVSELTKVIASYAYEGNVVILGRGANFFTPFAQGLHVRLTAPLPLRIQRAVDFEGHSLMKAKEVVNKFQKDRKDFVRQYFRKDIEDADAYDLTLNTAFYSVDQAAELIKQAFYAKFPRYKLPSAKSFFNRVTK